jgi:hypothetical protein
MSFLWFSCHVTSPMTQRDRYNVTDTACDIQTLTTPSVTGIVPMIMLGVVSNVTVCPVVAISYILCVLW